MSEPAHVGCYGSRVIGAIFSFWKILPAPVRVFLAPCPDNRAAKLYAASCGQKLSALLKNLRGVARNQSAHSSNQKGGWNHGGSQLHSGLGAGQFMPVAQVKPKRRPSRNQTCSARRIRASRVFTVSIRSPVLTAERETLFIQSLPQLKRFRLFLRCLPLCPSCLGRCADLGFGGGAHRKFLFGRFACLLRCFVLGPPCF